MARVTNKNKLELAFQYLKGTGIHQSQMERFIEARPEDGLDVLYSTYTNGEDKYLLAEVIRNTINTKIPKKLGRPSKLDKEIEESLTKKTSNLVKVIDVMTNGIPKAEVKKIIKMLEEKV